MDPAAGRGRGADRPRAGLLAGASPGAGGARGLRRHMAGSRVRDIGLLRARPTPCPSPRHLPEEPGARRLHRRRAHNDLGAK
jgi:hypothetical protein